MKKIAVLAIIAAAALTTACVSKIGEGKVAVQGEQFSTESYRQVLDKTYQQEETDLRRQDGKVYADRNKQKVQSSAEHNTSAQQKAAYSSANLQ